jgi:uncharacterized repeat protein (TIGR02543 family)
MKKGKEAGVKKFSKVFLCLMLFLCATIGCLSSKPSLVAQAEGNSHIVTFNYNTDQIVSYIPNENTDLMNRLKTYSITVDDGMYATETYKPGSLISPYYTYVWTYNGSVVNLSSFKITKDIEFKAEWTPRKYSVSFRFESDEVKNKITNLQTNLFFTVESPRINLYRPQLENYYFKGWYDSSSPIEYLYLPARSIGDKVLTARFEAINYYIHYNTDAVHNNPSSYNVENNDISLGEPSKEGHIFNGWYTDKEFKKQVTSIDTSIGGNIDLYPLWELETYKVTYILPNGLSRVVSCEYGKKADLPKLDKSIFEIVKTDVSRNNITGDTTIHIRYVNIWWVYVLILAIVSGIVALIITLRKKRNNTHNNLRMIYHSNANRKTRKKY